MYRCSLFVYFNCVEVQLAQTIFDLFVAGSETTSTTLMWSVYLLVMHPEIQQKMFDDIEENIGDCKLPETSDRVKLRYADAVVHEIQRFASLVPQGVAHCATEDGQVCGYDVPKGSLVISNIWSAHRSASLWKDPHNFNPDNFLDQHGNLTNVNYLLSFSTGKRVCLGESLAKQELFIFLVGLVQRFQMIEDRNTPLPSLDAVNKTTVIRAPPRYQVIMRERAK
jgi:cytochrome P450